MITISIVGIAETSARFVAMPAIVKSRLHIALQEIGALFVAHVARDKLSGQVLNRVTGTLRRSIKAIYYEQGSSQYIQAGSRGLNYAGIHEFGGVITHPTYSVTMPERSFIRSSLDDMREDIDNRLTTALDSLWRR